MIRSYHDTIYIRERERKDDDDDVDKECKWECIVIVVWYEGTKWKEMKEEKQELNWIRDKRELE